MLNASRQAAGEATSSDEPPSLPPPVDPGYALIRAVPPSAATLVHNAIMDMLRVPPAPPAPR